MKVLGINGSHRRDGNTHLMLGKALEVCERNGFDTEQVNLADLELGYCTVCDACKSEFTCSLEDDVMGVLEKMASADAILVATPVYFGGVTGRLRTLFDRTLPLRRNGLMLSGKLGAALAVGGSRNGGQEMSIQQIHAWMLIQEMAIVGDMKTAHFGGIATAHKPATVEADETGMNTVLNTAENICRRLK
ncbi:MAG: flavodoxin family protein [Candidatus Altiarchaeales archaeon]|nr:flavodoxin family protein [Candidatus Altiarchaeales archaeon]MBD3415978.1 flavodoxin family protein [Candidatus Altiarchaeales archaeon]